MKDFLKASVACLLACVVVVCFVVGCGPNTTTVVKPVAVASTGVKAVKADITPGSDGLTVEQRNVKARLEIDNKPGSIKHLYVFSSESGQCILYSTVKGKVTSSGKRLTPKSVSAGQGWSQGDFNGWYSWGPEVNIGNQNFRTTEVLEDDGTYGNSVEYVFWFDQRGVYHQHYVTGGQITHVASEPMPVKSIIVNIEATTAPKTEK